MPSPSPAFFGKIPLEPDFVRFHDGGSASLALARWLEAGNDALASAGVTLDLVPTRFLLQFNGESRGLIGVLRGSVDRIGRRFPLAVYASTPASELPDLAGMAPWFDAAEALLLTADSLSSAALTERVKQLPAPEEKAPTLDGTWAREALETPSAEFLEGSFGDLALGQQFYGLNSFRLACQEVRAKPGAERTVVLDCTAPGDRDRFLWLELARRMLKKGPSRSLLWRTAPPGRLLLAIGPPPPNMMVALAAPDRNVPRIWPLTTRQPAAIAGARTALGEGIVRMAERGSGTVAELLSLLEKAG